MKNKSTKGGARVGAGRKPAPIKKKGINFKIHPDIEVEFRQKVKELINNLNNLYNCS
jgi:hypothetical protein